MADVLPFLWFAIKAYFGFGLFVAIIKFPKNYRVVQQLREIVQRDLKEDIAYSGVVLALNFVSQILLWPSTLTVKIPSYPSEELRAVRENGAVVIVKREDIKR